MKKHIQKLIDKRHLVWLTAFLIGIFLQKRELLFSNFHISLLFEMWALFAICFIMGFIPAFFLLPRLFPTTREAVQFYLRFELFQTIWFCANVVGSIGPAHHFNWLLNCGVLCGYTCRPAMGMYWISKKLNYQIAFFEKIPQRDKELILKSEMLIPPPIRTEQKEVRHRLFFIRTAEFNVKVFLVESKNLKTDTKKLPPIFKIPLFCIMKRIERFFKERKMLLEEDELIYADDIEVDPDIVQRRHLFEQYKNTFLKEWGIAFNATA